jgi:hypothetical protein
MGVQDFALQQSRQVISASTVQLAGSIQNYLWPLVVAYLSVEVVVRQETLKLVCVQYLVVIAFPWGPVQVAANWIVWDLK